MGETFAVRAARSRRVKRTGRYTLKLAISI